MKIKMNIAIIAGQLVVGGAERQLYLWLSNLDRERYDPVVLTLHPGHADFWERPIEALGIPLYPIAHRKIKVTRLMDIIRVLKPYKPQLIHGWHLFASAYAGIAAKLLGARSLAGIRHTYKAFLANPMEARLSLLTADAFLTNSYTAARGLEQDKRRRQQQIFTVHNAVEVQGGDPQLIRKDLGRQYGIPGSRIWIGSVGRLDPLKRFDLALESFSRIRKENNEIHFILIGNGPEWQNLHQKAAELGLEGSVTFTGEIPNAKELLPALDIFCFTSVDEGMPNVIMEAAAAGLPILTWKLPFYEELLEDNRTGILVEAADLEEFTAGLGRLIADSDLRKHLGKAAQLHMLEAFSLEQFIAGMNHVYESVLEM